MNKILINDLGANFVTVTNNPRDKTVTVTQITEIVTTITKNIRYSESDRESRSRNYENNQRCP
jgi:hypothetical protein